MAASCATPVMVSVSTLGQCSTSGFASSKGLSLPSIRPAGGSVLHHVCKAGRRDDEFLLRGETWSICAPPTGGLASTLRSVGDHRLRPIVSAASGEVSVSSKPKEEQEQQRKELKEKLLAAIDAADGNLNEECVKIIEELAKFNPNPTVLEGEEGRKFWVGPFEGVKASFKGSGRKGGGKAEVGYKGAPATLGRLSFNSFKPAELEVRFTNFLNEVREEGERGYTLITTFNFDHPKEPALPPVEGIIFSTASHSNVGPNIQEVVFQSSVIRPRFPERDLEVWKEVFAKNERVDEKGQVFAKLPDHKGRLDYWYIDEELRITKGNFGSYVVVKRILELAPEFRP